MTAGEQPRPRGRPKGSKNRRAADLKGYIDTTYGGSAALQSARLCMVTPAELRAAGGSMVRAQVAKAEQLVAAVRESQKDADQVLRQVVREELAIFAAELREGEGAALRRAVDGFLGRVKEASSRFGLREALDMLARERAALLPYTDQRQPLAVDVTAKAEHPSVVIMGAEPVAMAGAPALENAEVFEGVAWEVARPKSHDEAQGLEPADLFGPGASAGISEGEAAPPPGG